MVKRAECLLELKNVGKRFLSPGSKTLQVLEHVDLNVGRGELIAILGPSGCGKSTLLNIIAGFEKADQGEVLLEEKPVQGPSSQRGVVFQNAVLFPWLTVEENIAFGLRENRIPKEEREKRIRRYLRLMHLEGYENYYGDQLSGGMQQRASMARVLVLQPQILLMDEPFSALDVVLRHSMQKLVAEIRRELSQTILLVTHDIEEALLLADRIYVMGPCPRGILQEIEVPRGEELKLSRELFSLKNYIMELFIENYENDFPK
ncbi:MAG: ABC transporter ATP-binding protein [Lachnospiraceae bacterium]|jgi:NitT/TauT family transport system ATP-binding protein|nr:ABC transporter ATP-binding protein [Lachnospiraceae bacterium]